MTDDPQGAFPSNKAALAGRVMELYRGVDQMLDMLKVPARERKEVEKNLMEAIAADLLVRLGKKLSEEERGELAGLGESAAQGGQPNLDSVAKFFKGKFTENELMEALAESSESVLKEFAATVSKKL